jgi:hypothetical protein
MRNKIMEQYYIQIAGGINSSKGMLVKSIIDDSYYCKIVSMKYNDQMELEQFFPFNTPKQTFTICYKLFDPNNIEHKKLRRKFLYKFEFKLKRIFYKIIKENK